MDRGSRTANAPNRVLRVLFPAGVHRYRLLVAFESPDSQQYFGGSPKRASTLWKSTFQVVLADSAVLSNVSEDSQYLKKKHSECSFTSAST